jgi:hypothetical protein
MWANLSSKFATGYETEASIFLPGTEEEDQVKSESSAECQGSGICYLGIVGLPLHNKK